MIEAVLFDMDGLMFDTERMWAQAWLQEGLAMGLPMTEEVVALMRGCNRDGCRRVCCAAFGETVDFDTLHLRARQAMFTMVEERGLTKMPGLDALLAELAARNIPAVVCTSTRSTTTAGYLKRADVDRFFVGIVGGDNVQHSKPHPEVFLKGAALAGKDPARCMVLEDSANGVRAGAAAGCQTVMVPDLTPPNDELRALAAAVVPDLFAVIPLLDTL